MKSVFENKFNPPEDRSIIENFFNILFGLAAIMLLGFILFWGVVMWLN